ncbi:Signal transduction histidine kinase CheA [hydrothermal vent metagenome]|uniref:Chemotaxis protein CheA n=1 Tax=hydrothermal vent metagenome TaxID=652676 RepID=A0A3B1DBM1_9ZZZZ
MSKQPQQSENMLVRSEDLDKLLTLAGEVIIVSSNQGVLSQEIQNFYDKNKKVDAEILSSAKDMSSSTALLSSDLHHLVQSIRTVDLKDLGFRFRRLVRNTSRTTGKPIHFEVIGDETTIDKAIVERLYDPISHQLRNAIDHGIEDMQTRLRNDKTEEGQVKLTFYNTEQETFIEIADDGAGINMESLRKKGIENGVVSSGETFTEETALRVMCAPGMSTAETISEVSGRGVGMDVVKNYIDSLGGSVSFITESSKGSTFTFRIPLLSAVNIVDALVVKAEQYIYAFPISNVVASISVEADQIKTPMEEGDMIEHLGDFLSLYDLSKLLNRQPSQRVSKEKEFINILIIEHKTSRIALVISEFLAPQKLVIIPFDEKFSVCGLVGSTILGARQLGFIIDVPSLIDLSRGKEIKTEGNKEQASMVGEPPEVLEDVLKVKQDEFPNEASSSEQEDASLQQAFIGELERLCMELNQTVFTLESNPGDQDCLNAAFRLFHTIKGNLIMMGFGKGGDTVHSVESVLDYIRMDNKEVTPEIMDIIMDGVSYIEELTQQTKAATWTDHVSEEIIQKSGAILPAKTFEQEEVGDVSTAEIKLSHEAAYRAAYHRRNKKHFYRMYIEFDAGVQPSFLVACLIYKRISELGDVLGTVPLLADIEKGMMEGKVKFLFASDFSFDNLEKGLKDLLIEHYGATLVKLKSVAS